MQFMRRSSPARSSLRMNVVANYAGQLYAGLIGLLMVPVYLKWLNAEAYGLIGFFALLQSWAQLLDLGFSASVSRESSRYAGGELDRASFRRLMRAFEWVFWIVGALLAVCLAWQAERVASSWLNVQHLRSAEVQHSIQLMAVAIAMRWVAGLYRGVVAGVERQVWLNVFTVVVVTLRFVVAVPVAIALGGSVTAFFAFQVVVAAVELGVLWLVAYRAAPSSGPVHLSGAWPALRSALRFSAWAGIATIIWVLVSQVDKLVISTAIPLADFGFFTAAVSAAGAVSILSTAVTQALLPRMIQLASSESRQPVLALYSRMTQAVVAAGVPLALTFVCAGEPLLWAWTGDHAFATEYSPVLALYAAGNVFMLLAAFPYCLQYAMGDLRLHVAGNLLLAALMIPLLPHVTANYGALGAAWAWAGFNGAFFVLWTPLTHARFAPGAHRGWLLRDVGRVAALPCALAAAAAAAGAFQWTGGRLDVAIRASITFAVLFITAACMTDEARSRWRALVTRLA